MKWTRNLKGWKINCWNWCGSRLTANSLNKTAAVGKSVLTQMWRVIWTVFQWRCDGEWSHRRKVVSPQHQQQYHRIRNTKTSIGVTGIRPWNGWRYACLQSNDTLFHRKSRKYIQRTTQNNHHYNKPNCCEKLIKQIFSGIWCAGCSWHSRSFDSYIHFSVLP